MKYSLLLLLQVTFFCTSFAKEIEVKNKNITPFNEVAEYKSGATVSYLQQANEWKQFLAQYPSWSSNFSSKTMLPHRAFGNPISFAPGGNDVIAKAKLFLEQALQQYNIPINELVLSSSNNDGKYINVNFKQIHQGKEVLWSRATVRFTQDLKIILFGTDVYRNIQLTPIVITANDALKTAEDAIVAVTKTSVIAPSIKIIAVKENGAMVYKQVYEVIVTANERKIDAGKYLTYIDATTGEIVYRQNKINNFDVKVKADIYPTNQFGSIQAYPLKNLAIVNGATTYYTNANGVVTIPSAGPISAITKLVGKYVEVLHDASGAPMPDISVMATNSGDSIVLAPAAVYPEIAHYGVYYHVNAIHDFMKTKFPTFTAMDNALPAYVQRTDGTCNAFYDGVSINFYAAGSGCADFAYISDVMYHEYGHGINDKYYTSLSGSFDNGAMNEGYADCWAFCLNHYPIIGEGYDNTTTGNIRQYNAAPKVYPQDIVGEVHADGEIIAGAWWDTGVNWASVDSMSDLYAKTFNGMANGPDGTEGQVYLDILIDALNYDDNDANLNNGTPHMNYIVAAFAKHGITLLAEASIQNNVALSTIANTGIPVSADVTVSYPMFLGDLKMYYRLKGINTVDSLLLTKSGTNYTGTLPGKLAGDIIEYYYQLYDNSSNKAGQLPFSSSFAIATQERNIPYNIMVGYSLHEKYNFDDSTKAPLGYVIQAPLDGATGGKWIIAKPTPSYFQSSPLDTTTLVQTGRDHTTGIGNCLVTGNASSPTSSSGSQDVDGGRTTVITSDFDLTKYDKPVISYWRWFSNSQGNNPRKDQWRVYVSYNSGSTWVAYAERTYQPDVSWRQNIVIPNKVNGNTFRLRFVAIDTTVTGFFGGSLVEAAIDDIELYDTKFPTKVTKQDYVVSQIFPNPANNLLSFRLNNTGHTVVKLINSLGQIVYSKSIALQNNTLYDIHTDAMANGLYVMQITQDKNTITEKVEIRH